MIEVFYRKSIAVKYWVILHNIGVSKLTTGMRIVCFESLQYKQLTNSDVYNRNGTKKVSIIKTHCQEQINYNINASCYEC